MVCPNDTEPPSLCKTEMECMKKMTVTVNNNCILVRWTPIGVTSISVSTCISYCGFHSQHHLHKQHELLILNFSFYFIASKLFLEC